MEHVTLPFFPLRAVSQTEKSVKEGDRAGVCSCNEHLQDALDNIVLVAYLLLSRIHVSHQLLEKVVWDHVRANLVD